MEVGSGALDALTGKRCEHNGCLNRTAGWRSPLHSASYVTMPWELSTIPLYTPLKSPMSFGPPLAYRLDAIPQGAKNSRFPCRAQPPPTSPRNGSARIKNIMHGAV
jgi:hypothetical protein